MDIRKYASSLGIKLVSKKKTEMIQEIQIKEGNTDCFSKINNCIIEDCKWSEECQESFRPKHKKPKSKKCTFEGCHVTFPKIARKEFCQKHSKN